MKTAIRPGTVIWLTGLSGGGKSTIGEALLQELRHYNVISAMLDGDRLRQTVCRDLGMSPEDRAENVRRTAEIGYMMAQAGVVTIVALTSPAAAGRQYARDLLPKHRFIEVWVDCPVAVCVERDPKGLYRRYERGEIKHMVGIDLPYETPADPEVHVRTDQLSLGRCLDMIFRGVDRVTRGVHDEACE